MWEEAEERKMDITREELDRAFDERFPAEIREKLRNGRAAIAGLEVLDPTLRFPWPGPVWGTYCWSILMSWMSLT